MQAAIRYRIAVLDPRQHLYDVTLEIDQPAARQRLSLPVWIPGSYLVREFSQQLQGLQASCADQPVALQQITKNCWEARLPDGGPATLQLRYQVHALDASVRTAFLDPGRGFFNPTSLCLRVHGRDVEPQALELVGSADTSGWQAASGLTPTQIDANGFGHYLARDYDELADCPFELGRFWRGAFEVRGVPHRLIVSGAGDFADCERLLRDTQRICETEIAFWHPEGEAPPFENYLFMLHASQDGYGGLEHRNSTALICQRADLPRRSETPSAPGLIERPKAGDGYTTLLGLISHEYFHSWNVKRLRPHEFRRYDYERENYTELLWFFEGFTSYYDDLLLLRAGLIDEATYLQLLSKGVNQLLQTPGRRVQSAAQSSFDAWVKYYRNDANTPNATVSYYTKGALVALCLDLTLRAEGHASLDDVMRALMQRCQAGPMREADLLAVLKQLGRRSYADEIAAWVHGTDELPLAELLPGHGLQWSQEPAPLAQRLGLRVSENGGLTLKQVLRGGAAEAAGLAPGDEWLGVELDPAPAGGEPSAWRVRKLDEVALYAAGSSELTALIARDGRLLRCRLRLRWPALSHEVKIERQTAPAAPTGERRWLQE